MDINNLVMFTHNVFYGTCDNKLLVNYCFIIQLDGCMYSLGWVDNFMLIMVFSIKLVNNKVVDNLLMI